MSITRHCGVVRSTGSRVFILWRQLENDPAHCLVIYRDSLPEAFNGKVTELVLGVGQSSIELWEVMDKVGILEGKNMLSSLHSMGYIRKQNTLDIDVHVGGNDKIPLNVLNDEINRSPSMVDGSVKEFNPFNQQKQIDYPEQGSIVQRLLDDARKYEKIAKENYERAYSLDPSLRPTTDVPIYDQFVVETPTQYLDSDIQEEDTDEDEDGFYFKIPEGISQTKAIELLKTEFKARQSKDA